MDCCVFKCQSKLYTVQEVSIEKLAKIPERDLRWSVIVDTKTKTEPNYRDIVEQRINESHFYRRVKGLFLGHENTLLHVAAYFGNLLKVKAYTQLQPSVYDPLDINRQGNTALHVAVEAGYLDIVRYFIEECQVSASSLSDTGLTPLHTACQYKQYNIAKYLIYQGVDPLVENDEKETPLFIACRCGDEKMVEFLVTRAMEHQLLKDFIHSTNVSGETVLHCAVESGNVQLVKTLISKYKMPPEVSENIIHSAVSTGSVKMVSYFCSLRNCNTNAVDNIGNTVIHIAAKKGYLDILQFFFTNRCCRRECFHTKNIRRYTPLHSAAEFGRIDCVKYLLEFVNGNVVAKFGLTPLHVATKCGRFEVVKLLAEHYPEHTYQQDKLCLTPLHSAVTPIQNVKSKIDWTAEHLKDQVPPPSEYFKIVKFLTLKMKCDPDCGDKNGSTPFHYAAMYGSLEMVKFLVNKIKINPNARNKHGNLPLHLACRTGRKDVVQFLLESGKSIRDNRGPIPTSLHYACECEKPDVFIYLTTKQGYVPSEHYDILQFAAAGGCVRTIEYLVHSGCNAKNEPILSIACMFGHTDAVRYLIEECGCDGSKAELKRSIQGAAEKGRYEVLEYLTLERQGDLNSEDSWDQTVLHAAVRGQKRGYDPKVVTPDRDHMKTIKLLVEDLNCSPNHPDSNAITPLQLACMEDKMEIVRYFLGKCEVVKDHFGRNPLHWAAMGSAYEVVEYLISQQDRLPQYSPLCKDEDGNTPLHLIAFCGELSTEDKISRLRKSPNFFGIEMYDMHMDIDNMFGMTKKVGLSATKYLIHVMRGNTSVTNNFGQAPIHLACKKGNISIVKDLKQALSSPFTLQDSIGRTPLHYAAMGGHLIITQYLVSSNADPLSEDVFHNLPLHYAAALGHLDVVQFLVKKGSPLTAKGVWYKTPAEMAAAGRHKNVLDYLNSQQSKTVCMYSKIVFCT